MYLSRGVRDCIYEHVPWTREESLAEFTECLVRLFPLRHYPNGRRAAARAVT
jgi:hypothetical protein